MILELKIGLACGEITCVTSGKKCGNMSSMSLSNNSGSVPGNVEMWKYVFNMEVCLQCGNVEICLP